MSSAFAKFDFRGAIHVAGSTTIRAPMQLAAEAFMTEQPGMIVTIAGGGSGRGLRGLIGGTIELAMATTEVSKEEQKDAAKQGQKLVSHVLGHDAIVPVVHPGNPVQRIALDDLRGIYSGEIRNWKDLGGPDAAITVLAHDPQSGTAESWHHMVLKDHAMTPKAIILEAKELRARVAQAQDAIGYVAHTFLDKSVREVVVDGVTVSVETIRNGRYPLRRAFSLVSFANPPGPVQDFIDYMRAATKGQVMLAAAGNVTLK